MVQNLRNSLLQAGLTRGLDGFATPGRLAGIGRRVAAAAGASGEGIKEWRKGIMTSAGSSKHSMGSGSSSPRTPRRMLSEGSPQSSNACGGSFMPAPPVVGERVAATSADYMGKRRSSLSLSQALRHQSSAI